MELEGKRAVRLAHMIALNKRRLATESAEEREARLARMTALQQQRLALETEDEREIRLLHKRTLRQRDEPSHLPPLESNPSMMLKFHQQIAKLELIMPRRYTPYIFISRKNINSVSIVENGIIIGKLLASNFYYKWLLIKITSYLSLQYFTYSVSI